jgi:hypothetical protein
MRLAKSALRDPRRREASKVIDQVHVAVAVNVHDRDHVKVNDHVNVRSRFRAAS